jgi:PhnB protein
MRIDPYLFFKGNCEEAFTFYAKLLNGKIEAMLKHEGTPAAEHTAKEWLQKILHARLVVGDQVLMASDAPPGHQQETGGYSVALQVPTVEEAKRVFDGLAAGGKINMPLSPTFFAKSFGMLVDRFGTPWMVNCPAEGY